MNEAFRHWRDFKQRISFFALAKFGSISFGNSLVKDKSGLPSPKPESQPFLTSVSDAVRRRLLTELAS